MRCQASSAGTPLIKIWPRTSSGLLGDVHVERAASTSTLPTTFEAMAWSSRAGAAELDVV